MCVVVLNLTTPTTITATDIGLLLSLRKEKWPKLSKRSKRAFRRTLKMLITG
jgi:hypothetical protein